jgi:hypothetical protein
MEPITTIALSGIVYDMLKHSVLLTASNIKSRLTDWLVEDTIAEKLEVELAKLNLNDDMSEKAIIATMDSSDTLLAIMDQIKPSTTSTINQTHSGIGDNIATIKNA